MGSTRPLLFQHSLWDHANKPIKATERMKVSANDAFCHRHRAVAVHKALTKTIYIRLEYIHGHVILINHHTVI